MKKIILIGAILASTIGFSQDKSTTTTTTTTTTVSTPKKATKYFGKNEIKINALYFVLGAAELQYERILNDESSVGARTLFIIDDEVFIDKPFYLDGYYRFFFGEKPAAGFFVEGFANYTSIKGNYPSDNNFNGYNSDFRTKRNGAGLGIQVGGKFITRNGIIFELNGGVGRFITTSSPNLNKVFGRFAITAGYRF